MVELKAKVSALNVSFGDDSGEWGGRGLLVLLHRVALRP